MILRPAIPEDAPALASLWNPLIRDTSVTFNAAEKSVDALAADIHTRTSAGQAFLLAEDGRGLLGFATYTQFRPGTGYAHTLEHTIILHDRARGQGTGRALLEALMDHARNAGGHVLVACVSAENPGAIAFHERMGFARAGFLPEAGHKFGRFMDLVILHRLL